MTLSNSVLILLVILVLGKEGSSKVMDPGCLTSDAPMIIGGRNASQSPWMAYLHKNGEYQCGGSLVSNHLVLTAAHCANSTENLFARLGEYDSSTEDEQTIDVPIKQIITGPSHHDLSLLKFAQKVTYTEFIKPICILRPELFEQLPAVNNFILTGWGRTSRESQNPSPILQEMSVERMDPTKCEAPPAQICGQNSLQNVCNGDSGSPLVAFVKYNETTTIAAQYGILSHGHQRCFDHAYYVDVNHFAFFILIANWV